MKKLLALLSVVAFILWILPLGVFIKPSQQKLACDGQRAICMCHAMRPKSPEKAMEAGAALKAGSSASRENSSGSGGNYFVSAKPVVVLNSPLSFFLENHSFSYKSPFLALLDHVPKI